MLQTDVHITIPALPWYVLATSRSVSSASTTWCIRWTSRVPSRMPNAPELERRIDAALAGGVRWLIVDLGDANPVGDAALRALVERP